MTARPDGVVAGGTGAPGPGRGHTVARIAARIGIVLLASVAALACGAAWVLSHLDHPFVKSRVRSALQGAGVDVDYDTLSVSLLRGRIAGTQWVVAQPARFSSGAPPALALDAWSVGWHPGALLHGRLEGVRVELRGLTLTYAADESSDTLSELAPGKPSAKAPAPARPLSRALEPLESSRIAIERVEVTPITLNYREFAAGTLQRSLRLQGLALGARIAARASGVDGELRVQGTGARGESQLSVHQISRAPSASAPARQPLDASTELSFSAALRLKPAQPVTCSLSLRAHDAIGFSPPPATPLDMALELAVGFQPSRARTHLALHELRAFGDAINAQFAADIEDARPDALQAVNGHLAIDGKRLPPPPEGFEVEGLGAELALQDAELSPAGYSGRVQGRLGAQRISYSAGGSASRVEGLQVELAPAALTSGTSPSSNASALGPLRLLIRANRLSSESPPVDSKPSATVAARQCAITLQLAPSALTPAPGAASESADVCSLQCADVSRRAGGSSTLIDQPVFEARGAGLIRGLSSGAPTSGGASFRAARAQFKDGIDRVDLTPLTGHVSLDALRTKGAGLFGLGGRAALELQLGAKQTSKARVTELAQSTAKLSADFDHGELKASWPIPRLRAREGRRTEWSLDRAAFELGVFDLAGTTPQDLHGRARLTARLASVDAHGSTVSLPDLTLDAEANNGAFSLNGSATLDQMRMRSNSVGSAHRLEFATNIDLARSALTLDAHLRPVETTQPSRKTGRATLHELPTFDLSARAALDRPRGELEHHLTLDAQRLAALLAFALPEGTRADLGHLRVESSGRLGGLFVAGAPGSRAPARSGSLRIRGDEHARIELGDLELHRADASTLRCPKLTLAIQLRPKGRGAHAEFDMLVANASFKRGPTAFAIAGFHPRAELDLPDTNEPGTATLGFALDIDRIDHGYAAYQTAHLRMQTSADIADGRIEVRDLKLSNPAAKTDLHATLHYENQRATDTARRAVAAPASIEGRTAFSLDGELEQELAPLAGSVFSRASGRVRVPFSLRSGDLRSFRAAARIVAEAVSLASADNTFVLDRLSGEIPIDETLLLLESGIELGSERRPNALSRARFPDVQPYLNNDAYFTAERVVSGAQTLGPFAGNVRISGTTFSIDRLQVGYRGGAITGQLEADWKRGGSRLSFRGNATGIHTEHGGSDVLDANLALQFVPESLALDGSAQLVRLSKTHVLDLLDTLDPYHEDPRMNKTRSLLAFGYPRFARLRASEGLMDFELSLGGLAGAVSIDPIRAIPIAPLLDVYVAPLVDPFFPREVRHGRSAVADKRARTPAAALPSPGAAP